MEMKQYLLYIGVVLSVFMCNSITNGNFMRITGIKCRAVDPSFCSFEDCILKAKNRHVKEFNLVVKLHKKPVNNATVRVEVIRRLAASSQPLYQFAVDGCQFLVSKRRNPIAKAMFDFLRLGSYSNLNHSCPYNHDVIISHLEVQKDLGPGILIGNGDYIIKGYFLAYNVVRFFISGTVEISDLKY